MDSMTDAARGIVVGVDAHTDTHDACVLDDCGRQLGRRPFPADAAGYRELLTWVWRFGPIAALGVESTGSYAAGLVRHLRAQGLEVLEVNQPHPHTRRRRGKSEPIDAEMAARHLLAASRLVIAKDTTGIVESIRQLRVARDGAVKARSAALKALAGVIVTAPEELRQQHVARKTTRGRATLCAGLRADHSRLHEPTHAPEAALRSLARRVIDLDGQVGAADASCLKGYLGRRATRFGHTAKIIAALRRLPRPQASPRGSAGSSRASYPRAPPGRCSARLGLTLRTAWRGVERRLISAWNGGCAPFIVGMRPQAGRAGVVVLAGVW